MAMMLSWPFFSAGTWTAPVQGGTARAKATSSTFLIPLISQEEEEEEEIRVKKRLKHSHKPNSIPRTLHFTYTTRRNTNLPTKTNAVAIALQPSQIQYALTGFLSLPLEIRREIYRHVLVPNEAIELPYIRYLKGRPVDKRSLLLVSKQISEDAVDVLYSGNTFEVDLGMESLNGPLKLFGREAMFRIRKLQLVASDQAPMYLPPPDWSSSRAMNVPKYRPAMEDDVWLHVFVRLTDLELVVKKEEHYKGPIDPNMWFKWLHLLLENIDMYLPLKSKFRIEVGDQKTRDVIEEFFNDGERKVQLNYIEDERERGTTQLIQPTQPTQPSQPIQPAQSTQGRRRRKRRRRAW